MKCNKKMFLAIVTLFGFSVCLLGITCNAFSQDFGVILVAHKSTSSNWNRKVEQLRDDVFNHFNQPPDQQPIELAFINYGEDPNEVHTLRNALEALMVGNGLNQILLVPLSPFSGIFNKRVMDEAVRETGDLAGGPSIPSTIVIASAMGDYTGAITMLKECAEGLSDDPAQESLLLVGYGPCDDTANNALLMELQAMGMEINNQLLVPFQRVECKNLRPHCLDLSDGPQISAESVTKFREEVKSLKENGLVLVVPYVIQGDFHKELKHYLHGIVKAKHICKQEIISHDETEKWVEWVIGGEMDQSQQP